MEAYVQPPKGNIKVWMKLNLGLKEINTEPSKKIEIEYFTMPGINLSREYLSPQRFFDKVEYTVLQYFKIDHEIFKANRKRHLREYTMPRYIIFYFMDKYTELDQKDVSLRYSKNRSTLAHGIKTIKNLIDTNKIVREDIRKINEKFLTVSII